ncbi:hypothetical protein GCM10022243_39860 [Saccharothrix violaceirubra]|uniref:Lipoprotein LprG n=1 Tax=Saccharothrix violaceirubra TaxID=413306 RepID=A0A7W7T7X4_9PSEU|nr:LppX_LprAFG lipoprotein [Saccharothrix violaceirubra]MBB4968242.1 lipoprotein LprG [Saccharothrix violaceirubra]
MIPRRAFLGSLVLALVVGCSSAADGPAGAEVLTKAAESMKAVTGAHFVLKVDGTLPGVGVQAAEGDLGADGQSSGHARVEQFGQLVEVDYVLVAKDLYIKGATGGFTKVPAALAGSVYDPSAILSPDKGVAKVLSSARDPKTVSSSGGTHVVEATVPRDVVAGLVPGIAEDVAGSFSVKDDKLVKAVFTVSGGAKATIELSDFGKTVTVERPA